MLFNGEKVDIKMQNMLFLCSSEQGNIYHLTENVAVLKEGTYTCHLRYFPHRNSKIHFVTKPEDEIRSELNPLHISVFIFPHILYN